MNCQEARKHWNLYFDSEGDAELHFRVNEHLQRCSECTAWFDAQSRSETQIVETIASGESSDYPPINWQNVFAGVGVTVGPSRRPWRRNWVVLAAAASLIFVVATLAALLNGSRDEPSLTELSADLHRHLATGDLRPDFESDSDLAVDRYLVGRVSFPIRCPPREDSGFVVRGAGLCELANQPVAYVVGAVDGNVVSVFVLPKGSLQQFPHEQKRADKPIPQSDRTGGCQVVYSVVDQNLVMVVGNSPPEKLERVLSAYGTYPHTS